MARPKKDTITILHKASEFSDTQLNYFYLLYHKILFNKSDKVRAYFLRKTKDFYYEIIKELAHRKDRDYIYNTIDIDYRDIHIVHIEELTIEDLIDIYNEYTMAIDFSSDNFVGLLAERCGKVFISIIQELLKRDYPTLIYGGNDNMIKWETEIFKKDIKNINKYIDAVENAKPQNIEKEELALETI